MTISAATSSYFDAVERSAGRSFRYRRELEYLYELSRNRPLEQVFDDVVFLAKFISNASAVFKRTGAETEETRNLGIEFQTSLEKAGTLIRTIVKEAPDEVKSHLVGTFFSLTPDHLRAFMDLLYEMSWVKNFSLDAGQR